MGALPVGRCVASASSKGSPTAKTGSPPLRPGKTLAFADDVKALEVVLELHFQLVDLDAQLFLLQAEAGKLVVVFLHVFLLEGQPLHVGLLGFLEFNTDL